MSPKFAVLTEDNILKSTVEYVPIDNVTVPEYLYECYKKTDPDRPFLIDVETFEKLTYGEFMSKVESLALGFVDSGVTQNDMIFFLSDNSLSYTVAYFAGLFAGIPLWHVSPTAQPFELSQRISNVTDRRVILLYGSSRRQLIKQAFDEFSDLIQDKIAIQIEMDSLNAREDDSIYGEPQCELRMSKLIEKFANKKLSQIPYYSVENYQEFTPLIVCTSGTTGLPKGAAHNNYSIVNFLNNIGRQLKPLQGDKTLLFFATGHISGSMFSLMEFSMGNTVYLASSVSTQQMVELIQSEHITQSMVTPNNLYEIVTGNFETKYDLSSLKIVYTGGTILSPSFAETWATKLPHCPLLNFYGMTEFLCPLLPRNPEHANSLEHAGTVAPGVDLKILCIETGAKLGLLQSGEICVRGPACFRNYYLNPEATKTAIDSEGYYHSGDIGFIDKNLCVHINDRIKEAIKVFNLSVFPTEIEQFIHYKFPQVNAVCVVGLTQESGESLLRAYIALKEGTTLTEEEVIDAVAKNFIFCKQLRGGVVFIDQMPRTVIGKVDRQYFKRLIQTC